MNKNKERQENADRSQLKELMTKAETGAHPEKIPASDDKNYQFELGKQHAYSTMWFDMKELKEKFDKEDKTYINWKVMNLIIGFVIGMAFVMYLFNFFKSIAH